MEDMNGASPSAAETVMGCGRILQTVGCLIVGLPVLVFMIWFLVTFLSAWPSS